MPKAKHQRQQNMVTVQTITQIVEERDPTRTHPKNFPEMNAAGARAEDEPKQDQNKHRDPRAGAKTETKTNHHPPLHCETDATIHNEASDSKHTRQSRKEKEKIKNEEVKEDCPTLD